MRANSRHPRGENVEILKQTCSAPGGFYFLKFKTHPRGCRGRVALFSYNNGTIVYKRESQRGEGLAAHALLVKNYLIFNLPTITMAGSKKHAVEL